MSGCETYSAQIGGYVDGELRAEERAAFEAHLPGCASCTEALGSQRWLAEQLLGLPRVEPGPEFEAQFWARLAREENASGGLLAWLRGHLRAEWVVASALAAVLVLVFSTRDDTALAPADWEIVASVDQLELLETEELELLAALDVLERWDGSEEI